MSNDFNNDFSDDFNTRLYLSSAKDDLFDSGIWPKPFVFNEDVVRVFDDMVSRSVPLYREVLACSAHWARDYYQADTHIIDVGCSTGTLLELLGRFIEPSASLIGIDSSRPMLEKARQKLTGVARSHRLELICAGAEDCSFDDSSVVLMNYTLQFLPLSRRRSLLQSIYRGLRPGGLLFLSEKVKSAWPQFQETTTRHYEAFKAHNGYAHNEIERKKEALENVLIPLSEQQQIEMLHDSGFSQVDTLIKLHNFVSFAALKPD
jgi:tRNA (cmo5U34)-methyltransferase